LGLWEKCLDNYLEGDWVNAQANISLAQNFYPLDGPCRWLKEFMEGQKNIAPESWVGIRDIDLKMELAEYSMTKEDGVLEQDAGPTDHDGTNYDEE